MTMALGNRRPYRRRDDLRRVAWALLRPFWRCSPRPCWFWRNLLLRGFGARVGRQVRIYPGARIHQPWNLALGDGCVVARAVTLYALGPIRLGRGVVLSQGCHLCAGTHDHHDPAFPLLRPPIHIADGVWVAAEAFIGPGVTIGDRAVVGARAVVMRDVEAGLVVAGNPARPVGCR